jgi:hypothetical protein
MWVAQDWLRGKRCPEVDRWMHHGLAPCSATEQVPWWSISLWLIQIPELLMKDCHTWDTM